MKLLLDEHLSPAIAEQLRRRGRDVAAVAERIDLRGSDDAALLVVAAAERRVFVTQDIRDLSLLGARRLDPGHLHHGIVLVSRAAYPLAASAIGQLVQALDRLLAVHEQDDALVGQVIWLPSI